jgi:sulfate transport system permease protein
MKKRSLKALFLISIVVLWIFMLIMMPLYGIVKEVFSSGLSACFESINEQAAWNSFLLTLWLTLGSVSINTVLGVIITLVLVKQKFKGKLILDGLIDLPFAVSPIVAGFMFITLFGPNGWIGNLFEARGIKIIYAFPGMMLATLFVTFPFVVREVVPVLKEFGVEQEESAYVLGASKWQTFWRVTLPSIKWGLIYGITLTVARSIGEFGAVLVVSGAIINKTQTATLYVHQKFTDFDYAGSFTAAVILALISFLTILSIQYIQKNKA